MTELQRTGFFREMPHGEPTDPSLAAARNAAPTPHEARVIAYLDAGHVLQPASGPTHDVLATNTEIGWPHIRTDGRFAWPADLAHYVRTYHVRLSGAFIEHMLASGWAVPDDIDLATLTLPASTAARPDLARAFADFVGSLPGAGGVDTSQLKQSLTEAGAEVSRAVNNLGDELRRTLETAGDQFRSKLSSSLRALSDFLEQPEDERARKIQTIASSLEAKLDAVLTPKPSEGDGAAAAANQETVAERRERVAKDIQTNITAKLRQYGLLPKEPEAAGAPDEVKDTDATKPERVPKPDSATKPGSDDN